MLSIKTNESLITSTQFVRFDELYPHEHVIVERQNLLYKYLESLKPYAILPSIIICDKTNVIIDGHHRYISLIELGFKMIPTTKVNYKDKSSSAIAWLNEVGNPYSNVVLDKKG